MVADLCDVEVFLQLPLDLRAMLLPPSDVDGGAQWIRCSICTGLGWGEAWLHVAVVVQVPWSCVMSDLGGSRWA